MAGDSMVTMFAGDEVARLCPYPVLIEALADGHLRPPAHVERIVYGPPDANERFLALPAWQPGEAIGVKLVSVFPGNPSTTGLPSVQAVVVLFDGANGAPVALIDGTELTYRKTAADSALGARYLARHDASTLLMVGAGGLAEHLIAAHRCVRPSIDRVLVWNRSSDKAQRLVDAGVAHEVVADLDAAVGEADLICTATMARDPLIRGELLRPGTHVDCVGAFLPDHREVDDDVVRRAELFVDSRQAPIHECGDLVIPLAAGVIALGDIRADLYELCRGEREGRTDPQAITMFENGGGGHLDLMVAQHIWRSR